MLTHRPCPRAFPTSSSVMLVCAPQLLSRVGRIRPEQRQCSLGKQEIHPACTAQDSIATTTTLHRDADEQRLSRWRQELDKASQYSSPKDFLVNKLIIGCHRKKPLAMFTSQQTTFGAFSRIQKFEQKV